MYNYDIYVKNNYVNGLIFIPILIYKLITYADSPKSPIAFNITYGFSLNVQEWINVSSKSKIRALSFFGLASLSITFFDSIN